MGLLGVQPIMSLTHAWHVCLIGLYVLSLAILTVYGIHRYVQVFLYYRHVRRSERAQSRFENLPRVTVQLPMYNEMYVAERVIEAACRIDYPRHLLQIQVLDDSTDESKDIAEACCARLRDAGHDVEYIHRTNRQGYKAGALENGLKTATGEFVVIFDADFVPTPEILRESIDYFTDPNIGCVQSRWGHLNREQSLLTRCQAIFLDGHFLIEHTARNRSGRFINFNGTAGIWRKKAIEDSGGWQHDTLTEDMDLSYRAQVRGWRFVFLPGLVCPAELPPEMSAFKQQQHRWTKGSVQTAVKLLPSVLAARLPMRVKTEAFFHLTNGSVYLPAIILSLILFPTWAMVDYSQVNLFWNKTAMGALIVATFFGLLTCSAGTFYMVSQQAIGRSSIKTFFMIPFLMALGMGIAVINAVAVLEGLFGKKHTEFVRTPKYGASGNQTDGKVWRSRAGAFRKKLDFLPFLEIALGTYMLVCAALSAYTGLAIGTIPFLLIFAFGYLYVGLGTLHAKLLSARAAAAPQEPALTPAEAMAA